MNEVYEFPAGLNRERSDVEQYSVTDNLSEVRREQPNVTPKRELPENTNKPCAFCNLSELVAERGVVNAELELVREDTGEFLAYTCLNCLDGVPSVNTG